MHKLWQKKQTLKYSKDVLDIVQFGSSVVEETEPNDIDIAVIFQKISLKDQLNESQNIKKQIQENIELPIHISSFDLYSFFDKGNFAKEGVLFYGKSLIFHDEFSNRFGIKPKLKIYYTLKDLEKKDKIRFNYLLNGKGGKYGLIKKYSGKIISPGVIETSPEHERVFTEAMKKITKKIIVKKMFELIE
mgnify:CR=1 FL=1